MNSTLQPGRAEFIQRYAIISTVLVANVTNIVTLMIISVSQAVVSSLCSKSTNGAKYIINKNYYDLVKAGIIVAQAPVDRHLRTRLR